MSFFFCIFAAKLRKMKLSVFVVTYNQEQYIRQCLDSIVMQKVNFDYEVIIGEDCSTDGTGAVCDEFANRVKSQESRVKNFEVYHHSNNVGLLKNWEFVMNKCQGEYIALIEGDDYWIDENKLQRQVDWLDAHPDYTLTFTRAEIQYENGAEVGQEKDLPYLEEREYNVQEICAEFKVLSSSTVIRNCLQPIHYSDQLLYADTYTFIELCKRGKAYCFGVPTVKYRIHKQNLSYNGDWDFYVHAYNQCVYFNHIYPELRSVYEPRLESTLVHLLHDKNRSLRYRMVWMKRHPKDIFSRFMLATIKTYLFKM